MASEGPQPLEEEAARWNRAMEFLFKLMMGHIDFISCQLYVMESDREANVMMMAVKFKYLEVSVERKFIKLEVELISWISKLVSDGLLA